MAKRRGRPKTEPIRIPYAGALKAFAYSGLHFNTAIKVLDLLGFLHPSDDRHVRTAYAEYRAEARKISTNFKYARAIADKLGINPLYSWATSGVGYDERHEDARKVDRMLDELRRPLLRKTLDILLFLGWEPGQIAEALAHKIDAPVPQWDEITISMYRDFFWDTHDMSLSDWERYLSWWPRVPVEYPYRYVFELVDSSREELLWIAGITNSITPQEMIKAMMMECFMKFKRSASGQTENDSMMLKFMDAYRKLALTSKALGSGEEDAQKAVEALTQNLSIALKDETAEEPISREELGQITVSPRDSITLLELVEEEEDEHSKA